MNKMMTRAAVVATMVAGLAGCQKLEDIPFDVLNTAGSELEERFEDVRQTEDMPLTGSASYQGAAFFTDGSVMDAQRANATMVSEVELTADFARSSISGAFTNFHSADDSVKDLEGRLEVSDGQISDNLFDANLDGTFSSSRGDQTFDGVMAGTFLGEGAEAVSGLLEGEVTNTGTQDSSQMSGSFIAVND